ncbi:MAG TPA: replication factor C large subunit [Methanomassiliicoccales archaeon]|nr:replication factor C large subunit [Methanomassiliicoccales archaeon]HPR98002.1 replication factor C large subunit [Methanomassiliicoccales archaeon]
MADDWTELYRPQGLSEVVGNPKVIKDLQQWAVSWEEGRPEFKAVVLMGPPGVGKTSAALALARDFKWGVVEMNASDQRNADAIKKVAIRGSRSETFNDEGEFLSSKDGHLKLIILDEADNIFGREDSGGIPAIAELVAKTRQPVILIVNDFYELSRKSSAIKNNTLQLKVSKVQGATMRNVLRRIALDQELEVPHRVFETIIENSNGDMRAAVRDLQAVGEGNANMGEDDAFVLESRMSIRSMYDLMRDILHESDSRRARRTAMDVDETPEHIMMWLDENVPMEYKDPEDLYRALTHLARSSTFLARVTRRQYYGFWSYANDHNVMGVCSAKSRPYRGWVQYRFPSYIMKMSRSKAFRSMKSGIASKISEHTHTSTRRSAQDVLPYFIEMFKADPEFRLTMINTLRLNTEEVAFILDKKVDSSEVKKLMLESEKAKASMEPVPKSIPEPVEEKEEKPERRPEPKGKQASLFEY